MTFYTPLSLPDLERFNRCLADLEAIHGADNIFYADNLITFRRNLRFLRDRRFRGAIDASDPKNTERPIVWRLHVLAWAARLALRLPGDFIECGVYEGFSTRVLVEYLDFATLDRAFHLFDLFDNPGGQGQGVHMTEHDARLADRVRSRFAAFPNVRVVQGRIPESFVDRIPASIAFLHVDLNDAAAEVATLTALYDRLSPGAPMIFDDYGWSDYGTQAVAIDAFLAERGVMVLELPTGQGLAIKP